MRRVTTLAGFAAIWLALVGAGTLVSGRAAGLW